MKPVNWMYLHQKIEGENLDAVRKAIADLPEGAITTSLEALVVSSYNKKEDSLIVQPANLVVPNCIQLFTGNIFFVQIKDSIVSYAYRGPLIPGTSEIEIGYKGHTYCLNHKILNSKTMDALPL